MSCWWVFLYSAAQWVTVPRASILAFRTSNGSSGNGALDNMVWYYGYYSPAFRGISRGKRKETEDDGVPCILEADKSSEECRKNRARLTQKIYEVYCLTRPRCRGIMRIISFIEDREVIQTILVFK